MFKLKSGPTNLLFLEPFRKLARSGAQSCPPTPYCKLVRPNETTVQFEDNFITNYQKIYNTSFTNWKWKEEKSR